MVSALKNILTTWQTDGDFDAAVIAIHDTGSADIDYVLSNPLGRNPIGCQIIRKNKACDVFITQSSTSSIVVRFTAANVDLNLRVW